MHVCMYLYEHVWVFIFWLSCISCTYRKRKKKVHTKKEISGKSQNFIELLLSARPPPEIKILSVLVKISWEQKLNFPRIALFHMNTRVSLKCLMNDCGFFTGWALFQYGLRNSVTYIPFYSSPMNIKMQHTPNKDNILSKGN